MSSSKDVWKELRDAKGRTYYYNKATKETSWTAPSLARTTSSSEGAAIDQFLKSTSWRRATREDGKVYYFEKGSAKVQWEAPQVLVDFLHARSATSAAATAATSASPETSSGKKRKADAVSTAAPASSSSGAGAASGKIGKIGKKAARDSDDDDDDFGVEDVDIVDTTALTSAVEKGHEHTHGHLYIAADYADKASPVSRATFDPSTASPTELGTESPMYSAHEEKCALVDQEQQQLEEEEQEQEQEAAELTPEQLKLHLETKLCARDAALEPTCVTIAKEYYNLTADGTGLAQRLSSGYRGAAQLTGVLGDWLALAHTLRKPFSAIEATAGNMTAQQEQEQEQDKNENVAEHTVVELLCKAIKQRYSKSAGDALLLQSERPAFLQALLADPVYRRTLIELYDTYGDSPLLGWCVREISARGYHAEISAIIRESEYLDVFTQQLFSVLGRLQSLASSSVSESAQAQGGLTSLVADLRRACCSAEYLYLYATKLLLFLEIKLSRKAQTDANLPATDHAKCRNIQALVRRLRQELECATVWEKVPTSTSVGLDQGALFVVKLGGMYVRKLGSANNDPTSQLMYECLDSLRLREMTPAHAERVCRILVGKDVNVAHIEDITGEQLESIASLLVYLRHPELLRSISESLLSHTLPEKHIARYALLLALAARGGDVAGGLSALGWSTVHAQDPAPAPAPLTENNEILSSRIIFSSDVNSCATNVNKLVSVLIEVAVLARKAVSAATQHGSIEPDQARRLVALASGSSAVSSTLLLWACKNLEDTSLMEKETSLQLLPIFMQIAVETTTKFPSSHPECFRTLETVLGLPDPNQKQDSSNDRYSVQAARRDAWEALVYLLRCGYIKPPLDLFRKSVSSMDADLIRHVVRLLLQSIQAPLTRLFASELHAIFSESAVLKSINSEHFAKTDSQRLRALQGHVQHFFTVSSVPVRASTGIEGRATAADQGDEEELF